MKQSLVLLHGALGSKAQLGPLKEILEEHFIVYSMNFSGHGGVANSKLGFNVDAFAEDVTAFMLQHKLNSAHFFGYSMGGYVALRLAMMDPLMVRSIYTLGTKFEWTPNSAKQEARQLDPDLIEDKVPKFAQSLKLTHAPLDWKSVLAHTAAMMTELGNGDASSSSDFASLNTPVKITVGSADHMVSEEESRLVADLIPNCRFEIFPNTKHPIQQVNIAKISKDIVATINSFSMHAV